MEQITKSFLEEILVAALRRLHEKTGSPTVHAGPLATEMTEILHQRTGNRAVDFNSDFYGPILFGRSASAEGDSPKFRDFLRQFPCKVELIERYNGDLVRWLEAPREKPDIDELKRIITNVIEAEITRTHADSVSCSKLAILLKSLDPDFDAKRLGYESFHALLKSWPDIIEFTTVLGGGRVRLRSTQIAKAEFPHHQTATGLGYLLVDGEDLRQRVHELVGAKPAPTQFPDWTKVPVWIQNNFPTAELKCRYFMASGLTVAPTVEPFVHFLSQINFKVRSTPVLLGPDQETNRMRRSQQVSAEVVKLLEALEEQDASVFVVSHRPEIANAMRSLIKNHPDRKFAVLGFLEFFPDELKKLSLEGLRFFDLVHDVHSVVDPLPRKLSSLAVDFNPSEYL